MKIRNNGLWLYGKIHQNQIKKGHFSQIKSSEHVWLVSLHGFMHSGSTLRPALTHLDPAIRVLSLDAPGHGESEACHNPERFRPEKQIEDLVHWLDLLKIDEVFVHGYSMGGRLCWQLLRWLRGQDDEQKRRFKGLILESAHPGLSSNHEKEERLELDNKRAKEIETNFNEFHLRWNQQEMFSTVQSDFLENHEENLGVPFKHDPVSYASCLRGFGTGMVEAVTAKDMQDTEIPLLLLAGERDIPYVKLFNQTSELSDCATFQCIPNAGHRCWQDNPKVWSEQINRFIL